MKTSASWRGNGTQHIGNAGEIQRQERNPDNNGDIKKAVTKLQAT